MQKLAFLVFAVFFALTTLAMAQQTRDGPGLATPEVLLLSDGVVISAQLPMTANVSTPALIDSRASPVFAAAAISSLKTGNRDLQRRVAPGGATHNRTIVSVCPSP